MGQSLYQLLYLSTAKPELTEDALLDLLSKSQARNAARGITGLLLHSDGNIIQVIEGEREAVESLYAKIESDPRHGGVMALSRKHVSARDFPEYKMGFRRTEKKVLNEQIPGFSSIVETGRISANEFEGLSKLVVIFLKTFARSTGLDT
jgi:acylphosphatase